MQRVTLKDKTFVTYITSDKISASVKQLAQKINTDLVNDMPLFLVVLNGSFMFAADLLKEVTIHCEISFIKLASSSLIKTSNRPSYEPIALTIA